MGLPRLQRSASLPASFLILDGRRLGHESCPPATPSSSHLGDSSSRHGLPCPSRIWRQDLAALCALSSFAHNAKEPIGGRLARVAPHSRQAAAGPSAGGQAAQYDPLGGTALAVDGQEAELSTNDPEFGTVRLTPTCAPRSRTPLATDVLFSCFLVGHFYDLNVCYNRSPPPPRSTRQLETRWQQAQVLCRSLQFTGAASTRDVGR
ncbi:hypothetical protein LZ31DRAFT_277457 [Colletotrichum somersetense]|nr:hypothetical protein LZ31DRAFT_277457 [Colletotrichum somersetense]